MGIQNIDFIADVIDPGGFLKQPIHEPFDAAKEKMNEWIERNDVEIVNIETVVLPSLHSPHEEGSEDVAVHVSGGMIVVYSQFVRLWYR